MPAPLPSSKRLSKKDPSPLKGGRHRLSAGTGRAVGDRRTAHRPQTAAAARLGPDWTTAHCQRAAALRLAVSGRLCPSRLGSDHLPSGLSANHRQHSRLCRGARRIRPPGGGQSHQADCAGARSGGLETYQRQAARARPGASALSAPVLPRTPPSCSRPSTCGRSPTRSWSIGTSSRSRNSKTRSSPAAPSCSATPSRSAPPPAFTGGLNASRNDKDLD
jgi:hypothetical protein